MSKYQIRMERTSKRRYTVRLFNYYIDLDGKNIARGYAWGEDAAWNAAERRVKRLEAKDPNWDLK